jgi:hypothetical protein
VQPRLTQADAAERNKLTGLLGHVVLCDGEDVRVSCLVDHKGKLKTSRLYKVLMSGEDPCPFARFI